MNAPHDIHEAEAATHRKGLIVTSDAGLMHDHCDWIAHVQSRAYREWMEVQSGGDVPPAIVRA